MNTPGAAEPALFVVVPNFNGRRHLGDDGLLACLSSLTGQSQRCEVILVDNGSDDGSIDFVHEARPEVRCLRNETNLGFAGGVNVGIRHALAHGADAVALFNNDAVAHRDWMAHLWQAMCVAPDIGITTGKFLKDDPDDEIDSTGDLYSIWGIPFPRGRDERDHGQYDEPSHADVFAATGGASLYRTRMFDDVGFFDEDFFAYYEDVDLSFRARLRGWSVVYTPGAVAHHGLSKTSVSMPGMVNYHGLKNSVALYLKNMPAPLVRRTWWRATLVVALLYYEAIRLRLYRLSARAAVVTIWRLPATLRSRAQIQSRSLEDAETIGARLLDEMPPHNAQFDRVITLFGLGRASSMSHDD